jgi:hypothetical protein
MSLAKDFRHIIVQGKKYRWKIKHRFISSRTTAKSTVYLSVEPSDRSGKALLVDISKPRRSDYLQDSQTIIKPQDVSEIISYAIRKGWKAEEPGLTFRLNYSIIN